MNMHGMKDEGLVALLLLASVLDVGALYISNDAVAKTANDSTFAVACEDREGKLNVTWTNSKGAKLGPNTRPHVSIGSSGTMIIFNGPLKEEDTGNYTCSTGKEKKVFDLFVAPPLEFKDTPTNQTGIEGGEAVLKCEVNGGASSWILDGAPISEKGGKFRVLADGLSITNVSRFDSKSYTCRAVQQRTGLIKDRVIHFHVKHKPGHPNHPHRHMRQEIVYSYINATVNLTCLAVANPPATFEWKTKTKKEIIGHTINESPDVSILQLHIDKSAFGNYSCVARNDLGTYEENFTLKQGTKPAAPSNVQVKETRSKSVILEIVEPEWTPEMELETKGFSIQFKKIDDKDWKQEEFNITKNRLYTLDGLEPNSKYQVRTATRNAAGLSDYFPSINLTTSRAATVQLTFSLFYSVVGLFLFRNSNLAFW